MARIKDSVLCQGGAREYGMSGGKEADSAAALLLLAATPVVHLDSDDDGQQQAGAGSATVAVSLHIFGGNTVRCRCTPVHSGLRASTVEIVFSKDAEDHKDRLFGSIDLDSRSDSSFAIVRVDVDNEAPAPSRSSSPDLIRVVVGIRPTDGHYFVRDFQTRVQTSTDQELALNIDPGDTDILHLQWRATTPDGCPLSLTLKGRRQVVI